MTARASRRLAMEAWLYRPCLVCDARMRSMPSAVRGPVLLPPCILHRPFFMAADRQGEPARVLRRIAGRCPNSPGARRASTSPGPVIAELSVEVLLIGDNETELKFQALT